MAAMGKHRTEKDYTKLYRPVGGFMTLVFVLALVVALLPQAPLLAAAQQETFQHWLNESGNWATGAINAQNSTYAEGDVVPHWIEWTDATVGGSATFSFSYEWQDASGHTGHDYLDDVNETEFAVLVSGLSSVAIPADSEAASQLGVQPPGQFLYKGFAVNSVSLQTFDHGDREDKYYTFTVTFTEAEAHLYYGAHLARVSQWPDGGASSFSGGNLENRFDRDGIGVGSSADQTRSIQANAIDPEPLPGVDVEKATNGEDADTGTGPQIVVGGQVDWTYVVTNIGNLELTGVVVADDQGVAVSCPAVTLAVGASMTCTASGSAVAGQYVNVGSVTTDQNVSDSDPSHYFGFVPEEPGVDVEKATNGEDADTGTGPQIVVGGQVDWTYVVTNIGNMELTGVVVADDQGVAVSCPAVTLAVGASMTCTASGSAVAGQYVNVGSVTTDQNVSDSDPSHYFGFVPEEPGVDVEKATNGEDADTGTGPQIVVGGQVDWTYVVTNIGNMELTGVVVADDQGVAVSCPAVTLAVGASMTCTASGSAVAGQYVNVGSVTTDQDVSDSDPSHYFGMSTPTTTTTTTTTTPAPSLGSIGDFVWDDGVITEANGIQDAGELGVGGITVNLYDGSGTTKLASRVTDGSGKYLFAGLSAGSYLVEFVIPAGSLYSFVPGNPGGPDPTDSDADRVSGRSGAITLSAGADDLSWDAGLTTSAVLPQVITTTTTSTPLEVLPFTGSSQGGVGIIGLILLMLGGLALLVAGRRRPDIEVA